MREKNVQTNIIAPSGVRPLAHTILIVWLIEAEWRIYASATWTIIGSDNGLSPVRRQDIIWTNAGILSIGPLGTNFSEILMEIKYFHSSKCILKCRLRHGGHFVSVSIMC